MHTLKCKDPRRSSTPTSFQIQLLLLLPLRLLLIYKSQAGYCPNETADSLSPFIHPHKTRLSHICLEGRLTCA